MVDSGSPESSSNPVSNDVAKIDLPQDAIYECWAEEVLKQKGKTNHKMSQALSLMLSGKWVDLDPLLEKPEDEDSPPSKGALHNRRYYVLKWLRDTFGEDAFEKNGKSGNKSRHRLKSSQRSQFELNDKARKKVLKKAMKRVNYDASPEQFNIPNVVILGTRMKIQALFADGDEGDNGAGHDKVAPVQFPKVKPKASEETADTPELKASKVLVEAMASSFERQAAMAKEEAAFHQHRQAFLEEEAARMRLAIEQASQLAATTGGPEQAVRVLEQALAPTPHVDQPVAEPEPTPDPVEPAPAPPPIEAPPTKSPEEVRGSLSGDQLCRTYAVALLYEAGEFQPDDALINLLTLFLSRDPHTEAAKIKPKEIYETAKVPGMSDTKDALSFRSRSHRKDLFELFPGVFRETGSRSSLRYFVDPNKFSALILPNPREKLDDVLQEEHDRGLDTFRHPKTFKVMGMSIQIAAPGAPAGEPYEPVESAAEAGSYPLIERFQTFLEEDQFTLIRAFLISKAQGRFGVDNLLHYILTLPLSETSPIKSDDLSPLFLGHNERMDPKITNRRRNGVTSVRMIDAKLITKEGNSYVIDRAALEELLKEIMSVGALAGLAVAKKTEGGSHELAIRTEVAAADAAAKLADPHEPEPAGAVRPSPPDTTRAFPGGPPLSSLGPYGAASAATPAPAAPSASAEPGPMPAEAAETALESLDLEVYVEALLKSKDVLSPRVRNMLQAFFERKLGTWISGSELHPIALGVAETDLAANQTSGARNVLLKTFPFAFNTSGGRRFAKYCVDPAQISQFLMKNAFGSICSLMDIEPTSVKALRVNLFGQDYVITPNGMREMTEADLGLFAEAAPAAPPTPPRPAAPAPSASAPKKATAPSAKAPKEAFEFPDSILNAPWLRDDTERLPNTLTAEDIQLSYAELVTEKLGLKGKNTPNVIYAFLSRAADAKTFPREFMMCVLDASKDESIEHTDVNKHPRAYHRIRQRSGTIINNLKISHPGLVSLTRTFDETFYTLDPEKARELLVLDNPMDAVLHAMRKIDPRGKLALEDLALPRAFTIFGEEIPMDREALGQISATVAGSPVTGEPKEGEDEDVVRPSPDEKPQPDADTFIGSYELSDLTPAARAAIMALIKDALKGNWCNPNEYTNSEQILEGLLELMDLCPDAIEEDGEEFGFSDDALNRLGIEVPRATDGDDEDDDGDIDDDLDPRERSKKLTPTAFCDHFGADYAALSFADKQALGELFRSEAKGKSFDPAGQMGEDTYLDGLRGLMRRFPGKIAIRDGEYRLMPRVIEELIGVDSDGPEPAAAAEAGAPGAKKAEEETSERAALLEALKPSVAEERARFGHWFPSLDETPERMQAFLLLLVFGQHGVCPAEFVLKARAFNTLVQASDGRVTSPGTRKVEIEGVSPNQPYYSIPLPDSALPAELKALRPAGLHEEENLLDDSLDDEDEGPRPAPRSARPVPRPTPRPAAPRPKPTPAAKPAARPVPEPAAPPRPAPPPRPLPQAPVRQGGRRPKKLSLADQSRSIPPSLVAETNSDLGRFEIPTDLIGSPGILGVYSQYFGSIEKPAPDIYRAFIALLAFSESGLHPRSIGLSREPFEKLYAHEKNTEKGENALIGRRGEGNDAIYFMKTPLDQVGALRGQLARPYIDERIRLRIEEGTISNTAVTAYLQRMGFGHQPVQGPVFQAGRALMVAGFDGATPEGIGISEGDFKNLRGMATGIYVRSEDGGNVYHMDCRTAPPDDLWGGKKPAWYVPPVKAAAAKNAAAQQPRAAAPSPRARRPKSNDVMPADYRLRATHRVKRTNYGKGKRRKKHELENGMNFTVIHTEEFLSSLPTETRWNDLPNKPDGDYLIVAFQVSAGQPIRFGIVKKGDFERL